jgi:hypothetical protein
VRNLEPVQFLWIGPELSTLERLSLASFLHHGHEVHLYAYDDVRNTPDGAVLKDAAAVISRDDIFTHTRRAKTGKGSYAGFANLFRYELLHRSGGWWADTDVICLRPLDFHEEHCFGHQADGAINNALVKAAKDSELTRLLVKCARRPHGGMPWQPLLKRVTRRAKQLRRRRHRGDLRWGQTGPDLFTKVVEHLGLERYAQPRHVFYPVAYDEWELLFDADPRGAERVRGSHAVHIWNEMLRRAGIDKNGTFAAGSLAERWKAEYLG